MTAALMTPENAYRAPAVDRATAQDPDVASNAALGGVGLFAAVCREQLKAVDNALQQLRRATVEPQHGASALQRLCEAVSLLKLNAGTQGYVRLVTFAHHVQPLLERLRDGMLSPTPALLALLEDCRQEFLHLTAHVAGDCHDLSEHQVRRHALLARVGAAVDEAPRIAPLLRRYIAA